MGAGKVARLLAAGLGGVAGITADAPRPPVADGAPALVLGLGGALDAVAAVHLSDGPFTGFHAVRDLAKPTGTARTAALSR
ncbi:hypothetical protein SJI45_02380 [Streptomyces sp. S399]|uniref:hypothetical protein n=1 Tax=Streptomyces sp. S399 TaxID=3096009 RepID=UPI002A804BF5|nr:hypothetical protein [Streptomyces sp. S399]WPR50102.1 hypothetical protein SJI45_02380 [Streptomyces sp. S399]